mgnify:CR=1 FL=1
MADDTTRYRPIYEFKDKIFHVHYKDIKLYPERLNDCGIMAYPLDFMSPKIPGLGDVDWADMYLLLQTSVTMVIHALRSRTRRLKVQGK